MSVGFYMELRVLNFIIEISVHYLNSFSDQKKRYFLNLV